MAETVREYRRVIDEIDLQAIPSQLQRQLVLRRRVQQLQQQADDEERRPLWEAFAAARQGSE